MKQESRVDWAGSLNVVLSSQVLSKGFTAMRVL